jgi:hypothetical protein
MDSFHEKLFVAHIRIDRMRRSNYTRSVEAKQLDDDISDTLESVVRSKQSLTAIQIRMITGFAEVIEREETLVAGYCNDPDC